MKLKKILKTIDLIGLHTLIFIEDEKDPIWEGSWMDIPWWLADMKVNDCGDWGEKPIDYRCSLGKEYNNEPGVVISLREG